MFSRGRSVGSVDDRIGFGESDLDIAFVNLDVFEQVALGTTFVDKWRLGFCSFYRIANDRQFFIDNVDQIHCGSGCFFCVGGHDRDCIAGVTNFVGAQHRPVFDEHAVQITARNVFVSQYSMDAGQSACCGRIDRADLRVCNAGAFCACMQHASEPIVICKFGGAGNLVSRLQIGHGFAD